MLKRYLRLFGFILMLVCSTAVGANTLPDSSWIKVQLDTHTTVKFPRIPEVLDSEGEYMLACTDSNYIYSAVASTLPTGFVKDSSLKGLQDIYRYLLAKSIKSNRGHILSIRNITIDSTTGVICSYRVDTSLAGDLGIFRTKQFWYRRGLLYGLEFWSHDSANDYSNERRDAFLSSFEWHEIDNVEPKLENEPFMALIGNSLKALIGGFIGVSALVFLMIRRSRRRRRDTGRHFNS